MRVANVSSTAKAAVPRRANIYALVRSCPETASWLCKDVVSVRRAGDRPACVTKEDRSSVHASGLFQGQLAHCLSALLSSERSWGEIERELRLRSDSGFPSASDTLRSVLS